MVIESKFLDINEKQILILFNFFIVNGQGGLSSSPFYRPATRRLWEQETTREDALRIPWPPRPRSPVKGPPVWTGSGFRLEDCRTGIAPLRAAFLGGHSPRWRGLEFWACA